MKLIAEISHLPCGGSDRLRFLLFPLYYSFILAPYVQITIATRHASEQFKGAVAWKCVCHTGRRRASDTCGVMGAENSGVFGSGTEFSSEDEEKVYGTLPRECLLPFEAPASVAALILGKDYFISSCSFLSRLFFISHSLAFHLLRFCADLLGDLLALALSLHSFPTSPFQSTPIFFFFSFFFTFTPTLFPLLPPLHPTLFLSFSISSILPFQHMTDCVINVHHKPLFLLATH